MHACACFVRSSIEMMFVIEGTVRARYSKLRCVPVSIGLPLLKSAELSVGDYIGSSWAG